MFGNLEMLLCYVPLLRVDEVVMCEGFELEAECGVHLDCR